MKLCFHVLVRHASQGSAFYGGVLVVGLATFVVLTFDTSQFSPGWYDPLSAALMLACLLVPIVAGVGAVEGQAARRAGATELALASPSGQLRASLMVVLATAVWPLAVLVVADAYFLVSGQGSASSKLAATPLAVLAVLVILGAAMVGVGLGSVFSSRLTPGTVAIAAFSLIYVPTLWSGWAARLSPLDDGTIYRIFIQPNASVLAEQCALFLGVGLLGAALLTGGPSRIGSLALGGLTAAAALVGLSLGDVATTQFRSPPDQLACGHGNVCVWPEHEVLLDAVAAEVALIERAVAGWLPEPAVWAEPGLVVEAESGLGVISLPERTPSPFEIRNAVAIAAVPEPRCSPRPSTEDAYDGYFALRSWLTARLSLLNAQVPQPEPSAVRLARNPEPVQEAWVKRQLQLLTSGCAS